MHADSTILRSFACKQEGFHCTLTRESMYIQSFRVHTPVLVYHPYTRFPAIHLFSHVCQLLEPPTLHADWVTAGHFACKQKLFCDTHTRGFRQNQPFRVYKPKKLHITNRWFPKMQYFSQEALAISLHNISQYHMIASKKIKNTCVKLYYDRRRVADTGNSKYPCFT